MLTLPAFFVAFIITLVACTILVPLILAVLKLFGVFTIVNEGQCKVYVLFGKVLATLNEPGLVFLPAKLGMPAFIVHIFGKCYELDLRLDQTYLRSQPVNSEEGAPMGIGIWYEMYISDPIAYLFKNADPRGSLGANVSNSTVRCLSNMPLDSMLENRHTMSQTVRDEVSPKSNEWGYQLGSVYIRKVHFRDENMIQQIESKIVNRLRQVTAAIVQAGKNKVNIITSTAERTAAIEFAKADAVHPQIVGAAFQEISKDKAVSDALFQVLEVKRLQESEAKITLIPKNNELIAALMAEESNKPGANK